MRRKRFVKLIMARGVERNFAAYIAKVFQWGGYSYREALEIERMAYERRLYLGEGLIND